MIRFKDFNNTAFSLDDAKVLVDLINKELKNKETVTIDFSGIKLYTSLFFNNSTSKYILEHSPEWFDNHIYVEGLTDAGESSYKHSYNNAVEYYNVPREERLKRDEILKKYIDIVEE